MINTLPQIEKSTLNPKQIQEAQKRLKAIEDTLSSIQRRVRKMEELTKKWWVILIHESFWRLSLMSYCAITHQSLNFSRKADANFNHELIYNPWLSQKRKNRVIVEKVIEKQNFRKKCWRDCRASPDVSLIWPLVLEKEFVDHRLRYTLATGSSVFCENINLIFDR